MLKFIINRSCSKVSLPPLNRATDDKPIQNTGLIARLVFIHFTNYSSPSSVNKLRVQPAYAISFTFIEILDFSGTIIYIYLQLFMLLHIRFFCGFRIYRSCKK